MNQQTAALSAEFEKNRRSKITWISFLAFAIAPVMGGFFMIIMRDPESYSGLFKLKAEILNFLPVWSSYFSLLSQAVGVGGVLIFGFAASWTFGREYSDGTAKDLLALPVSRTNILNAKFIYYALWCIALAVSNLVLGLIIGFALNLPGWSTWIFILNLKIYMITTILTIFINTAVAFFAVSGKGYLAPLGFVMIALVVAQVLGAAGAGNYFPWAIPGIYSGAGGNADSTLNAVSYIILLAAGSAGYAGTVWWWNKTDQVK